VGQPNQFTQAASGGIPKPPGANQFTTGKRITHDESTRDKLRSEYAARVLERITRSRKASISDKCAAAKALLPYGKPMLSSTEFSQLDPFEDMSVETMVEQCKALILSHPEIIQALNLIPNPAVVQQSEGMSAEPAVEQVIKDTGT